ncbi:peptidylprolyl isomerase [Alisedimentitalea sp. MJ-SS2]|uniref:peptidylprolyl isomerase n=1 Tax=Aliisedimentitalea sp. MJ-SS2 TaxID=3049795 RepID=UPI0029071A8E|nr:peptidylprolyl isomerase [Alisedimentitalea sp. MJ-SS2]MDU8927870.1 peptidylprolyl isomerase [Alisedimentitalea sp. MJ-SS2]
MSKRLSFMAAPLVALALSMAPAGAGEGPGADSVVATVNGTEITLGHMLLVRADLPPQYQQLPDDVLFDGILSQLVSQTLLEQSLKGDAPRNVRLALANERRSLLAAEAISVALSDRMTEEAIMAAYSAKYEGSPGKEFHASHILVESENEAKALISRLEGGADFATLAKEHSTGPSGPSGGDLGWFGVTRRMVPEFQAAVDVMEIGSVSAPVETEFGWHVIMLIETRLAEAPPLEEVRGEIEADLQAALIEEHIATLETTAKIDRSAESSFDPAILKDLSLLEN